MDGWLRISGVGVAMIVVLVVMQTLIGKDLLVMFWAFWSILSIGYVTSFLSTPRNYRGADDFRRPWLSAICIAAVALFGSAALVAARIWATVPSVP